jgi:hypothetical protein
MPKHTTSPATITIGEDGTWSCNITDMVPGPQRIGIRVNGAAVSGEVGRRAFTVEKVTRSDSFDSLSGYPAWSSSEPQTIGQIRALNNYLYISLVANAGNVSPLGSSGGSAWEGYMGSNWTATEISGTGSQGISVDQSTGRSGAQISPRCSFWSADSFSPNQFSEVVVSNFNSIDNRGTWPSVRTSNSSETMYLATATTSAIFLFKRVNGVNEDNDGIDGWLAAAGRAQSAGDIVRIEAFGSDPVILTVKVNGTTFISYEDTWANRIISGQPGLYSRSVNYVQDYQGDSWQGGDA